ncbi:hypothetical protein HNV11_17035 [Spirosoma taeanense]|uniref:Lipoprotein n=1 Tax=Spirosoma taeanense TaxID=2735870 RepID=A0A6M5YAE0_9BACT|nr:hypothetical protein [Spirosoma taeanense]QJW90959.1 hypothetical protein HNV11_17035 [Spirosoma taeanense]
MLPFAKRTAGFLIAGTAFFFACQSASTPAPTDYVSLKLNQSARLASDVVVRVDSIQDSRCPTGTTCIWAGQAWVNMLLSAGNDASTVRLALGPDAREGYAKRLDSTNVSLNSKTYKVILREVNPYPTASTVGEPQTAVIQVTKL